MVNPYPLPRIHNNRSSNEETTRRGKGSMKTTNTQKKSSKRTRAAPDHTNQLMEIPAQPVEVLSPRQTLVQTVCSLTGTKEAQAMQIASNHLYEYCLTPDKEVAEFVGHLEAIELLCDCLAFGMLDGTSRSQADQIDWLIRFVKEYKKTKATLVSPTRKKPDQSVWKANTKVMV